MITRSYVNDYRLSETVLANGRIVTEAVYIGDDYHFEASAEDLGRTRRHCVVLTLVCWAALIGTFFSASGASRLMYVVLPHACCIFPLAFLSESVWHLWRASPVMTRERAGKISDGLPLQSMLCLIFSAAALIGFAATAFAEPKNMVAGDIIFALFSVFLAYASAMIFSRRKYVKTKKSLESDNAAS